MNHCCRQYQIQIQYRELMSDQIPFKVYWCLIIDFCDQMYQSRMNSRESWSRNDSYSPINRSPFRSARSTQKNSSTREIIIKTEEPDIPLISILKVQNSSLDQRKNGCHFLARVSSQMIMKRLYKGFTQLSKNYHSSRAYLVKVNRLAKILNSRKQMLKGFAWTRLISNKIRSQHKLNACKFIFKALYTCQLNLKRSFVDKVRLKKERDRRSLSQNKKFQNPANTSPNLDQEFSPEFISVCRTLQRQYGRTYVNQLIANLDQSVDSEIKRYRKIRGRSPSISNNEIVLIIMENIISTVKNCEKQIEQKTKTIQERGPARVYDSSRLEGDFQKYDKQIRQSLDRHNSIPGQEMKSLLERQIRQLGSRKNIFLVDSRIFIMSLVVKALSAAADTQLNIVKNIEQLLNIANNVDQLKAFQNQHSAIVGRGEIVVSRFAKKLIQMNRGSKMSIREEVYSENEENFKEQIKYLGDEIKSFLSRCHSSRTTNKKIIKIFSNRKPKAKDQFQTVYAGITDMANLIQRLSHETSEQKLPPKAISSGMDKSSTILSILNSFIGCLNKGSYDRWQAYLKTIKTEDFKEILNALEKINEILNDKIEFAEKQSVKRIQVANSTERRLKDENERLKQKQNELQRKIRTQQTSRIVDRSPESTLKIKLQEKDKKINSLETKYSQLSQKYNREHQNFLNSQSDIKDLRKKHNDLSREKQKMERTKTSTIYNESLEQKVRQLQSDLNTSLNTIKKNNYQLNNVINQNTHYKNLAQKFENEAYILRQQLKQLRESNEGKKSDEEMEDYYVMKSSYEESQNMNSKLKKKLSTITDNMEKVLRQFEEKDKETNDLRRMALDMDTLVIQLEKSKNQEESLMRKVELLENSIHNFNLELERLKRKNSELEEEKQNFNRDIRSRESQENIRNNETIRKLTSELSKFQRKEQELYEANRHLQIGGSEQSYLQKRNKDLHLKIQEKEDQIYRLQRDIREFEGQILTQRNQITRAHDKITQNETENQEKDKIIANLQSLIAKHESEMKKVRNELIEERGKIYSSIPSEDYIQLKRNWEKTLIDVRTKDTEIEQLQTNLALNQRHLSSTKSDHQYEINNYKRRLTQYEKSDQKMRQSPPSSSSIYQLRIDSKSSAVNLDSVILLLTNILSQCSRVEKDYLFKNSPSEKQKHISDDIRLILYGCKNSDEEFYKKAEKYAIEYLQKDICSYRDKLAVKIEFIENLKQSLGQFLDKEFSKQSKDLMNIKYQFEDSPGKNSTRISASSPFRQFEDNPSPAFRTPELRSRFI